MLDFLYTAVSWVLLRWHQLLGALGLDPDSGLTWALSIVLLVITARVLLFRLFIKQVHYQRNMQRLQPKIAQIREKYKSDRAEMNRQMMKFQQEEGFNPLAGCLPMVLQLPVFLGLYHTLRHLSNSVSLCNKGSHSHLLTEYTFSRSETCSGAKSELFGAPLAASFRDGTDKIQQLLGDPGATAANARWVILPLLIISAAATFLTQLMIRLNNTSAPAEGTAATVQRIMLYIVPGGVLVSGLLFNFPLGVLLYWFTSNLWTLAQQAYIIRYHPPDTPETKPVGELGKTLAPRPGQRPVRDGRRGRAEDSTGAGTTIETSKNGAGHNANGRKVNTTKGDTGTVSTGKGGAASSGSAKDGAQGVGAVPRPGQRPNRTTGKRPPAKKPTQAKKRR